MKIESAKDLRVKDISRKAPSTVVPPYGAGAEIAKETQNGTRNFIRYLIVTKLEI